MASYSTSYFEDPDEEEKQRALAALAGADAPAAIPIDMDLSNDPEALAGSLPPEYDLTPPEPESSVGGQPPPVLPSDPFDRAAAAMAEEEAPSSGGGGMDWGPLGGGVGWAALADLAINGGRGIPQVIALGAQAAEQRKKSGLEAEYKRAQIRHLDRSGGVDPRVLEQRQRQMDQRDRALQHSEEVLGDRQGARGEKTAQGKTNADALRRLYADRGVDVTALSDADLQGLRAASGVLRKDYEIANADQLNEAAAGKAGAVARATGQARSDVGAENADQDAETAARKAGAVAEAQAPFAVTRAVEISNRTLPDKQALKASPGAPQSGEVDPDTGEKLPSPGQKRKADMARMEETTYAGLADKYIKETEYERNGAVALQRADQVLAKYKGAKDLPGAGTLDSLVPDRLLSQDAATIRSAQAWMNNAIQRADSGAAAPIPEETKFAIRNGAQPGATEQQFRIGMNAAREQIRATLRAASAGKERAARDVLGKAGIADWALGPETAPDSAAISPETLPVTNQKRRDVPKVDDILRRYGASWVR
jgi:hypothetical protein